MIAANEGTEDRLALRTALIRMMIAVTPLALDAAAQEATDALQLAVRAFDAIEPRARDRQRLARVCLRVAENAEAVHSERRERLLHLVGEAGGTHETLPALLNSPTLDLFIADVVAQVRSIADQYARGDGRQPRKAPKTVRQRGVNRVRAAAYPTLREASLACQRLGITRGREYKQRYQEDPRLLSNPRNSYRDEWYALPKLSPSAGGRWAAFFALAAEPDPDLPDQSSNSAVQ